MRFAIQLNAVKSGERIVILPMGELKGRDGRYWILTPEDAAALVGRLRHDGVDIPVDYDHGTYGDDGRAAAWLSDFQVEERGLTAVITFTPAGQAAVDAREYRYLSPAFYSDGTRIVALESVALTNIPNLTEIPALNAKEGRVATEKDKPEDRVKELELQLNQSREAERGQREENTRLLVELNEVKGKLAAREQADAKSAVEGLVDQAIKAGKLFPAQRDSAVKLGLNSREALEELIKHSGLDLKKLETIQANEPKGAAGPQLDDVELQMCALMGLSREAYAKSKE